MSIFSAVTVVTHLPPVVTAAVRSGPVHLGLHVLLVVTAVLVWWPLLGPLPEAPRLTAPVHRMLYIFGQSLVPSMVGSALIWTTAVPYRVYEEFPPVWGIDDLADQQWAGVIMEVIEGLVLVGPDGRRLPASRAPGAALAVTHHGPPGPHDGGARRGQAMISIGTPSGSMLASLVIPLLLMRMQPLLTSLPRPDGSPVPWRPRTPVPPSPKDVRTSE